MSSINTPSPLPALEKTAENRNFQRDEAVKEKGGVGRRMGKESERVDQEKIVIERGGGRRESKARVWATAGLRQRRGRGGAVRATRKQLQ